MERTTPYFFLTPFQAGELFFSAHSKTSIILVRRLFDAYYSLYVIVKIQVLLRHEIKAWLALAPPLISLLPSRNERINRLIFTRANHAVKRNLLLSLLLLSSLERIWLQEGRGPFKEGKRQGGMLPISRDEFAAFGRGEEREDESELGRCVLFLVAPCRVFLAV